MYKRLGLFLISCFLIICVGAVAVYAINPYDVKTDNIRPRIFGFDIYRIPSKSMQPLLFPGDYISVSNFSYAKQTPKRQDVVVFYQPKKNGLQTKMPFIKRIIGIAGDKLLLQNGKLFINKQLINEHYVAANNNKTPYSLTMKHTIIPQDHVFVMGDNRDNSSDSRIFGPIPKNAIIAKATDVLYGINNRSGRAIK